MRSGMYPHTAPSQPTDVYRVYRVLYNEGVRLSHSLVTAMLSMLQLAHENECVNRRHA